MAICEMGYKIASFGLSDLGLVRKNNEDAWVISPEFNLYIIADGMGGHPEGEVRLDDPVHARAPLADRHDEHVVTGVDDRLVRAAGDERPVRRPRREQHHPEIRDEKHQGGEDGDRDDRPRQRSLRSSNPDKRRSSPVRASSP